MKFRINENNTKLILIESTKEEYNQLKRLLQPFVKNYRFMERYKLKLWDGKVDYFKNGIIDIGLWFVVYDICQEYGYSFQIENKDKLPKDLSLKKDDVKSFCDDFYKDRLLPDKTDKFYPHDHQIEAIYRILKFRQGQVEVATAGGKSLILSSIIFYIMKNIKPDAKFLIIVPSILLVNQFYDDILDYNYGFHKENDNPIDNLNIIEIMSEHPRKNRMDNEPNIYIGTYQSLEKYPLEFFKQFDLVAVDEAHKIKSVTIQGILSKTIGFAKYRFGVTGTLPEKQTAEAYAVESLTGPNLFTIKAKELQEKGIIAPVKIKSLILYHGDEEFGSNVYNIRRRGGGKKAFELEKNYIHNSENRKRFVGKLVQKIKKNSLLLFHTIEYGTTLYDYLRNNVPGFDFYYIDGSTPLEKRNYIKKQMENTDGNVKILVASFGTLSTGVSIKAITNLVFLDSFKSNQLIRQCIGRVLRLHKDKEFAIIFDLVDRFSSKFESTLYQHYKERRDKIYKVQEFPFDEIKITL